MVNATVDETAIHLKRHSFLFENQEIVLIVYFFLSFFIPILYRLHSDFQKCMLSATMEMKQEEGFNAYLKTINVGDHLNRISWL